MNNILNNFRLNQEKEDCASVVETIDKGLVFKGTNLWILVFAIFIASLGLNVNSTAVIIGAMLVSPLMGPIMGLGLGVAINDIPLLKKSLFNYLFAAGVSLVTSTLYFSISPLSYMVYVAQKQYIGLIMDVYVFLSNLVIFYLVLYYFKLSVIWAVGIYSLNYAVLYLITLYYSYKLSQGNERSHHEHAAESVLSPQPE